MPVDFQLPSSAVLVIDRKLRLGSYYFRQHRKHRYKMPIGKEEECKKWDGGKRSRHLRICVGLYCKMQGATGWDGLGRGDGTHVFIYIYIATYVCVYVYMSVYVYRIHLCVHVRIYILYIHLDIYYI